MPQTIWLFSSMGILHILLLEIIFKFFKDTLFLSGEMEEIMF